MLVGQAEEVGIDADDAALDLLVEMAEVLAELAQRRGAGDGGDGLDDPVEVLVGQAVLEDEAVVVLLPRRVHVVDRLGAADDDVGGAQLGDLPLGLGAGALGDGQHGDHRRDAEDQAQDREQHAQLVQRQVAQGQGDGDVQVGAWWNALHFTLGRTAIGLGRSLGAVLRFLVLELGGGADAGVEGHVLSFLEPVEDLDEFLVVLADLHLPAR